MSLYEKISGYYDELFPLKKTRLSLESDNFTFQREYLYDRVSHRIRFQGGVTEKKSGTIKKYNESLYPLIFMELRTALIGAGFSQLQFFGDESKVPYTKQSPALIAVAEV
jgi:hypothetical protein